MLIRHRVVVIEIYVDFLHVLSVVMDEIQLEFGEN